MKIGYNKTILQNSIAAICLYLLLLSLVSFIFIFNSSSIISSRISHVNSSLEKLSENRALQIASQNKAIDSVKKIISYEFKNSPYINTIIMTHNGVFLAHYGELSYSQAKNYMYEIERNYLSISKTYPNGVRAIYLSSLDKLDDGVGILSQKVSSTGNLQFSLKKVAFNSFKYSILLLISFIFFFHIYKILQKIISESRNKSKQLHDLLSDSVNIAIFSKVVLNHLSKNDPRKDFEGRALIENQAKSFIFTDYYNRNIIHNQKFSIDRISVKDCLDDCIKYLASYNSSINRFIDIQSPQEILEVIASRPLLTRVFQNLIMNAFESIKNDESIKITFTERPKHLLICFSNPCTFKSFLLNIQMAMSSKGKFRRGNGLKIIKHSLRQINSKLNIKYENSYVFFYFKLPKTRDLI